MKIFSMAWRLGWTLFIAVSLHHLVAFGTRWELGRYYMPRSLVSAEGRTYADGSGIDAITAAFIRADREEELMLVLLCILAVPAAFLIWTIWKIKVEARRRAALLMADIEQPYAEEVRH